MHLNESSRHYLTNYFLLEQTRNETNQFLETIALELIRQVESRLETRDDGVLAFDRPWVQNGGGDAGVLLRIRDDVGQSHGLEGWKYYVQYRDAMRAVDLNNPTNCLIWGNTPRANAAQIRRVSRVAAAKGLPDPYRVEEVPLTDAPVEEVIERISNIFMGFCDEYARVVQALVDEPQIGA